MNRTSALALLLAIAVALALRLPHLDARPLHNDEAVNAIKLAELLEHGKYVYDANEYHGPTLHYFSLPFLWLTGARTADRMDDSTLRLVTVAFGVGLILVSLLFVDRLGRHAIVWSAIFTAISPAMVFYSRYFIHEMLLVFFTALTIGAGWRWYQTRLTRWAIVAGAGLGLMSATKETFVLALAGMGIAAVGARLCAKHQPQHVESQAAACSTKTVQLRCFPWSPVTFAFATAFLVWLILFSSFFTNWNGLADSVRTYLPWLKRAGGESPHIHPWSFYLERLVWFHPPKGPLWSEGLILVFAVIGIAVSFSRKKSPLHRFLAIYTITLTIIYSVISYKTPWCLLGFWHGTILLAGVGAVALWELARGRVLKVLVASALGGVIVQLAPQAWRASFDLPASNRNPYAYAQTSRNALELVKKVEGIGRIAPAGYTTVVKVIAPESDYWPLPWYLRRFQNTGWYSASPADPYAPVVIAAAKLDLRLDEKSDKKWIMAGLFEFRPGYFMELYVELELWRKFVETLPREKNEP
jgi:uncharacterized protein (TIGR03663 family)